MKKLTEEEIWKLIAEMGWNMDSDYHIMAKKWFAELGTSGMKQVQIFVAARIKDLYDVVAKYQATTNGSLYWGSDDSVSDLRYHIVGNGKAIFDLYMKNPRQIQGRYEAGAYKESFSYVFQKPEPVSTKEDKEKTVLSLIKSVKAFDASLNGLIKLLNDVEQERNSVRLLLSMVEEDNKSN